MGMGQLSSSHDPCHPGPTHTAVGHVPVGAELLSHLVGMRPEGKEIVLPLLVGSATPPLLDSPVLEAAPANG